MNCKQIEPWISVYQDGELDPRRRYLVEEHLACCPDCRALSLEWVELARELRAGLTWSDVPETLHTRVMRQIPERKPAHAGTGRAGFWRPHPWLSFALVPLAAAAAWLLLAPHPARPTVLLAHPLGPTILASVISHPHPAQDPTSSGSAADPVNSPGVPRHLNGRAKLKAAGHSLIAPAPAAATSAKRGAERSHPETELHRQMRQFRPQRRRYRIAAVPPREWISRRSHRRWLTARAPQPRFPMPERSPAAPSPPVTIVDYVLPEAEPQLPAVESGTEYVLQPAEPAPKSEAGVAL